MLMEDADMVASGAVSMIMPAAPCPLRPLHREQVREHHKQTHKPQHRLHRPSRPRGDSYTDRIDGDGIAVGGRRPAS